MTWKGVDDVQVNQLCLIYDGSKRKKKQMDRFGFGQHILPARGESKRRSAKSKWKLPIWHHSKLTMHEKEELEKSKKQGVGSYHRNAVLADYQS